MTKSKSQFEDNARLVDAATRLLEKMDNISAEEDMPVFTLSEFEGRPFMGGTITDQMIYGFIDFLYDHHPDHLGVAFYHLGKRLLGGKQEDAAENILPRNNLIH